MVNFSLSIIELLEMCHFPLEIWGMPSGIVGLKLERSHGLSYCRLGLGLILPLGTILDLMTS